LLASRVVAGEVAVSTTTPKIARNSKIRTIVAIPIPITELLLISFKFSSFVIPASIRRCAPANVMYPPTVPPRSVRIAGKILSIGAVGTNVSFTAIPTGGFTIRMTTKITTIMIPPRIFVSVSIASNAFL